MIDLIMFYITLVLIILGIILGIELIVLLIVRIAIKIKYSVLNLLAKVKPLESIREHSGEELTPINPTLEEIEGQAVYETEKSKTVSLSKM